MNIRFALKSIGTGLLVTAMCSATWAQEKSSLPEFFGFYALDGGRNVAIYEGKGSGGAKSAETDEYSIQQNSKFKDTMPQISTLARFLLFYSNSGEIAQSMWLYRLPMVRQIIETLPPDAFNPPTRHVIDSPNVPLLARIPELAFTLLAKPVANQPQMVELVPSQELAPGLYVIGYGIPGQTGWAATFAVTSSSEGEHQYCIDLILPGGPRGLFERANSELNTWAPLLASYRYIKCDTSTVPNAPAVSGVNSSESNTAVSGPTDLTAAWNKALEQGQAVSIPMCRRASGFANTCDKGTMSLGAEEIAFLKANGQKIFTAIAPQIKFKTEGMNGAFEFAVGKKSEQFRYIAQDVECSPILYNGFPVCPAEGIQQQVSVRDWVQQALGRLASGSSNASPQK